MFHVTKTGKLMNRSVVSLDLYPYVLYVGRKGSDESALFRRLARAYAARQCIIIKIACTCSYTASDRWQY